MCSTASHSPLWSSPSEAITVEVEVVVVLAEVEQPPLRGPVKVTTDVEVGAVVPKVVDVVDVPPDAPVVLVDPPVPRVVEVLAGAVVDVDVEVLDATVVDVAPLAPAVVGTDPPKEAVVVVESTLDGIVTPTADAVSDIAC